MTQQPWPPPRRNRTALFVVLGLVATVVVAGAVALVVVLSDSVDRSAPPTTGPSADEKFATTRDDALAAGEEIAAAFNTLDYQSVEEDLDRWESLATGDLLTELKNNRDKSAQTIKQSKSKTEGTVLSAAVSELDQKAGTASLIAAVKVEVSQDGAAPTEKRLRLKLTLTKTDGEWRVSELGQVPAGG